MRAELELLPPNVEIAAAFAIDGIFNTHDSAEKADLSVAAMEPDSIVFLENKQLNRAYAPAYHQFKRLISSYTEARLLGGKTSDGYAYEKAMLIESMSSWLEGDDNLAGDQACLLVTIRALAEKDCAIFFADADVSVPGSNAANHTEEIEDGLATGGLTMLQLSSQHGALDNYRRAVTDYNQFVRANHMREADSVDIATAYLRRLLSVKDRLAPDLGHSSAGKMQVYALWGTRHAHSLTRAYGDAGLTMTPKVIADKPVRFITAHREDVTTDARRYAVSDLAEAAIFESGYHRIDNPLDPAYFELHRTVRLDTSHPPIHTYARLFSLYKDAAANPARGATTEDTSVPSIEHRKRANAHNLYNLLGELGLNGAQYLDDPHGSLDD